MRLISGGAIAGAVAGAVLALAAIIGIVLFILRRRRVQKQNERQAANRPGPQPFSDQLVYANYAKPSLAFSSPPQSPPLHSRQPSDHIYMFGTSPPQSDLGNHYFSPETVNPKLATAELEVRDEGQHNLKQ